MSGTTFTTYPVQSHKTAQTAHTSGPGTDHAASLEKSYLSASRQSIPATQSSTYAQHGPGPGLTTLAVGEEDGGGMAMPPAHGPMSTPQAEGGFQVTTLAIGEEDGGGYGTMQPIRDDHGIIGGASVGNHLPPVGNHGASEAYGRMQPIYSPGEAEYPAFAKTSQTPDLLNFHPVARVPKTAIAPPVAAAAAPVTVAAPTTAQPITMAPSPVGIHTGAVPQSGDYQTVGSYEDYLNSVSGQTTAPAAPYQPAPVEAGAVYEPLAEPAMAAPSYAPIEDAPSQPAYETYQPAVETGAYDSMRTSDMPTSVDADPAYVEPQPVAPPLPTTEYVAPAPAVERYAPVTSVEPQQKPDILVKDAPFDYTGAVEPADPADGNPDYVAPVETTKESAAATEITGVPDAASQATAAPTASAASTTEPSYVSVPIDAYLVDPAEAEATSGTANAAPAEPVPADEAPTAASSSAPVQPMPTAAPAESMSLGGSYRVMDSPLPGSLTGISSGAGTAGPSAPQGAAPGTPDSDLQIMTLSNGEEAGTP